MIGLSIDGIVVRYGQTIALRSFSMDVAPGDRVALIGPNGAGKSTVTRALSGLVRPHKGTVRLDGREITGCSPREAVEHGLVLIPQGRKLFGSMTVRENLEMGAYLCTRRADVNARVDKWMDLFPELAAKLSARASTLSGGQQQLVSLIRGLMPEPKILMLDEPSMGVAPMLVRRIGEELVRLNEETGLTIILVEQNIDLAFDVGPRVVVLAQGRSVHESTPEGLSDPAVLAGHFFGTGTVGSPSPASGKSP